MDDDFMVMNNMKRDLGLSAALLYAERMANVPGGHFAAQYRRIAEALKAEIDVEFNKRLQYLHEVSQLPGYHPVEGDLGSIPV